MSARKLQPLELPRTDSETKATYLALCAPEPPNAKALLHLGRPIDGIAAAKLPSTGFGGLFGLGGLRGFYEPTGMDLLFQAIHFACLVVDRYSSKGHIYVPELDADVKAVDHLFPVWIKHGGSRDGLSPKVGHDINPGDEAELLALFADPKRPKPAFPK